jgi:hypothetical protein
MLSTRLKIFYVIYASYACIMFVSSGLSQQIDDSQGEETKEVKQHWVSEVSVSIKELFDLADDTPEIIIPDSDNSIERLKPILSNSKKLFGNGQKGEDLIWKLWLTTGLPPLMYDQDKSLRSFLFRSASAYHKYVTNNAYLTEEELNRVALSNAINSIGSPMWYTTLEFLENKTGCKLRRNIIIDVFPHHRIMHYQLPKKSYHRLSKALRHWLSDNRQQLKWDSKIRRFRPSDSGYVGTDDLSRIIREEFQAAIEDQRDLSNDKKDKHTLRNGG